MRLEVRADPSDLARASRLPRLRDGHPFAPLRAGSARVRLRERDAPATTGEMPALHQWRVQFTSALTLDTSRGKRGFQKSVFDVKPLVTDKGQ